MSQYTDLFADIVSWTNRPEKTAETNLAIKQAIRAAHKAGNWYRDLATATLTNVPIQQIQEIDFTDTAKFTRFKQIATIKPTGRENFQYKVVDVLDLVDQDGYDRYDVAYVVGNIINIRAAAPTDAITCVYYQRPDIPTNLDTLNDWIVDAHYDLIVLWAAASVLANTGEQEIKTRVEGLAKVEYMALIADNQLADGR